MPSTDTEVLFVLGTRPEIIKLAPVLRSMASSDQLSSRLLHTGQHYDDELSDAFFDDLGVPAPDDHLGVGSGTQAEQTGAAMRGVERIVLEREPDVVIAVGDTNAVLSAALAAAKLDPLFAHVEAGIRSFDRSMPEETNRVVADHVADIAFAPTETAVEQLTTESVAADVHIVGNTVVDACIEHVSIAERRSTIREDLSVNDRPYAVATIHRPRNTDDRARLQTIVEALDEQPFPVVFPVHPRTGAALEEIEFEPTDSLRLVDPLGYLDFLNLLSGATVAITDSGGVQEEASILGVPCLTVRPNTERPETVEAGANRLVEPHELFECLGAVTSDPELHAKMTGATDLYGDGTAGDQIVSILEEVLD
ncbi:UDP-N-acetylglucosamine 2-epimerase (non-hydrolyzing) [Salinarchaeum chitinilyticum]